MAGQLVLKSQNAVSDISGLPDIQYYINRVIEDGGVINNMNELLEVFSFIYANSISSDSVVSATNPNWGIKKGLDGVVSKLYSLFDSVGDINFSTTGTVKPLYNTTNNFPSVYFAGSDSCYGKLSGLFDIESSVATVTVNSVPVGVAYGTNSSMPVSLVWSEKNFKDGAASADCLTLGRTITKPTNTNTNPDTWWNSISVAGLNVGSATTAINRPAKPIAAYMSTNSGLDILSENGSVAHTVSANNNTNRLTNLTFLLGTSVSGSGVSPTGNIVSHFFENWVLRDISIQKTLLFTKRVNDKYYNKI